MNKKVILIALSITILFTIPLLAIPITNAADHVGWLDVRPLGSGTASYKGVVGGSGQYIYAAQTGSDSYAFMVISISDPASPTIVGFESRASPGHIIHSVDVNPAETVAVVGVSGGIYVIDISDKANPTRTAYFNFGSSNAAHDVEIVGDLVYCAAKTTGLPVINISDINSPTLHWNGDYGDTGTLGLYDIKYDSARNVIYGAMSSGYFRVFSLDGNGIPSTQSTIPTSGNRLTAVEKISDYRVAVGDSCGVVTIINTQNLATPSVLGSVDIGGEIGGIAYTSTLGSYFLAIEDNSLKLVSFASESAPSEAATLTKGSLAGYDVAVTSTYAMAAGGGYGLYIYRISDLLGAAAPSTGIPGFTFMYIVASILTIGLIIIFTQKSKFFSSL
ncbi:MAG: LVIVD repeat-containing protein [Candidatus Helarchaeota archaeon]